MYILCIHLGTLTTISEHRLQLATHIESAKRGLWTLNITEVKHKTITLLQTVTIRRKICSSTSNYMLNVPNFSIVAYILIWMLSCQTADKICWIQCHIFSVGRTRLMHSVQTVSWKPSLYQHYCGLERWVRVHYLLP